MEEIMICSKWRECGIDCEDKKPHEKELACNVECDWRGVCIPYSTDNQIPVLAGKEG